MITYKRIANCAKCRQSTGVEVTVPYAKLVWCESCQEPDTAKSQGHMRFIGSYEYYEVDGQVYAAHVDRPVMPDGRRSGRWECPMHLADSQLSVIEQFSF
jgi:hypothetical protein